MATKQRQTKPQETQEARPQAAAGASRWLGVGGGIALLLAALAVLLAWQRSVDERRSAEDVKARVAAEMQRIEAEEARLRRESAK